MKLGRGPGFFGRPAGLTLVELMITIAILGVGVIATMGSFRYISTAIQHSKTRTLSSNLGQEQIEKLKNLSYYSLLVTTSTMADPDITTLSYDTGNYPATSIIEGGIYFRRATRVDFAYQSGSAITLAPWSNEDTGLKQITTYVIWKEGNEWKYNETKNLVANPATSPLNATLSGTVTKLGGGVIAGALIRVGDNAQYYGYTDNSGNYSFTVSEGSYTLVCSSRGYFSATTPGYLSITSGITYDQDFVLSPMSSGTVLGYAYQADHLVISQIVTSTGTANGIEFVEIFNPTPNPVVMGVGTTASVRLYIFDHDDQTRPTSGFQPVPLVYVSTYVPAYKGYLIANTSFTFAIAGGTRTPDAYYDGYTGVHLFEIATAGGAGIATTDPEKIDAVAWSRTNGGQNCPGTPVEGNCVPLTFGLGVGEGLVRMNSPGFINTAYGRAYDSEDNESNFAQVVPVTPRDTQQPALSIVAASPATGATVNVNDPLSSAGLCNSVTISGGYCPSSTGCTACAFSIPSVATGTWNVDILSGNLFSQIQNVTVSASVSTGVPNGATTPAWNPVKSTTTILSMTTSYAFISGYVRDAIGNALTNIEVTDNQGRSVYSASTGKYFLMATTGTIQITANPNNSNQNKAYVSVTKDSHTVLSGQYYDQTSWTDSTDFYLSRGTIGRGFFRTASATPLPGRTAVAIRNGNQAAQAVSDNTGHFYLLNLSTGTYLIQPSIDPAEVSSPSSSTVVLTATGTVAIGTFTVSNGLSEIYGQVLKSSDTIKTGTLIVASTTTMTGGTSQPPPTISGANGILCSPCYYAASSDASGNYSLFVRSSASPYYVYGWYTTFSGQTPTVTRTSAYQVSVSTGGQSIGVNLQW